MKGWVIVKNCEVRACAQKGLFAKKRTAAMCIGSGFELGSLIAVAVAVAVSDQLVESPSAVPYAAQHGERWAFA
jgi:hypothetical protein